MNKRFFALAGVIALSLTIGCTPMEEKRDTHLKNARAEVEKGDCAKARAEAEAALALDASVADGFFIIAKCDLKEEKYKEAGANFAKGLALSPDSIEALRGAARAALVNNQLDEAKRLTDRAEAFGDTSGELNVIQGGIAMKQKLMPLAISYLTKALDANPNDEEAIVGLSSAYLNSGQREKASELLAKAETALPNSPTILSLLLTMALQNRETDTAEKYLQRLLLIKPGEPDLILQSADLRFLTGKKEEGLQMLTGFLEAHPDADAIRVRLASIDADSGNFDKGLALLDAAPQKNAVLQLHKASILGRAGKTDEAVKALKELAANASAGREADDARFGLVEIYLQQNKEDEALAELDAILAKNPDNVDAYSLRGRIYFTKQRFIDAISDLEKAHLEQPANHYVSLALADAYNASGNPSRAEEIIGEIIRMEPRFSQAYLTLSNLYLMQERPEAALMTLDIGKTSAPDDASIPFAEADILTVLGRFDKAAEALEPLAAKDGIAETALMRIANIYGEANNHAKAIAAFDRVLKLNPAAREAAEGKIRALLAQNKAKAALEFAEKRFTDRKDDPAAAFIFGETALAARNADKAEKGFARALELAPKWDQPLTYLAQIYSAQGKQDKALQLAEETAAKAPDSPGPALVAAMLHEQKADMDAAEKIYREILAKNPDNALACNNLAFLLTRHKPDESRLKEAESLALIAAKNEVPATLDTLGWIQHLLGKNEEAEKNIRLALAESERNPTYSLHLAAALAELTKGKTDDNAKAQKEEAKQLLLNIIMESGEDGMKKQARAILDALNK
ncbi:tetratricopeptide repeat protein [Desulfovibrio sp. OttesenSCG-928-G15]|nr:tetratricopeptide repeat protein [Desulfovibrio sp. OttesenSCG-928-G15]